jgi:BTB/POZ domain
LTSSIVDIYVGPDSTRWPLHERLLCYHSPFLSSIFHADDKDPEKESRGNKSYRLSEEDDDTFELVVGWLYSKAIRAPKTEAEIAPLLDVYLLAEKLEMKKLSSDVVDLVREWYYTSGTYPGMRRVQYIYSETNEDNEMREMMVSAVARQLTTTDKIPEYWAKALQRNGQLAVDIIRAIQQWHLEERSIPDTRDSAQGRGRKDQSGFSAIEREADSLETVGTSDTNMGVESVGSDLERSNIKSDDE